MTKRMRAGGGNWQPGLATVHVGDSGDSIDHDPKLERVKFGTGVGSIPAINAELYRRKNKKIK